LLIRSILDSLVQRCRNARAAERLMRKLLEKGGFVFDDARLRPTLMVNADGCKGGAQKLKATHSSSKETGNVF
jgi:transposase-like protein